MTTSKIWIARLKTMLFCGRALARFGTLSICLLVVTCPSRARAQVVKAAIPTAPGPSAIAVNPVTNTVYVANSDNVVTVINGATLQSKTVAVGSGSVAIDIDTATNKIFVANRTSSTL